MMEAVLQFLYGGLAVMSGVVGFFFLRYWYTQRDRFFLWFMIAFWSLGAGWGAHMTQASSTDTGPQIYVFRLISFLLIIAAIIDKNRRTRG